jgi:hypothetical protein
MATKYISPTGNDTTGDGSSGNPYLTMTKALTVVSAGDTISLLAGTYTSTNWPVQKLFTSINVVGTGIGSTIFDGTGMAAAAYCGIIETGGTLSFSGIRFQNFDLSTGNAFVLFRISEGINLSIHDCLFTDIKTRDYYEYTGLIANPLSSNLASANVNVYSNSFKNIHTAQCFYHIGARRGAGYNAGYSLRVYNNVFYWDTGKSVPSTTGVLHRNDTTGTFIAKNNIFMHYDSAGAKLAINSNITASYNCIYNFSAGIPAGSVTSDPLLVDPTNNNFNLRPSSPCIGTGGII